jgi:mono/diheme cytochrome c family protein
LAWDAEKKQYNAQPTEANAHFTFYLTNVSSSEVMINSVRTSCGCTAAKLPQTPWRMAPGQSGPIEVDMNIVGKRGVIPKSVTVDTSAGMKYLIVESHIADAATNTASMSDRDRNQMLAKADPLAIFKGDCAKCHVEPTAGKMGKDLYASACSICHNAEHRAAMVPDLQDKYRSPMPPEFWKLFVMLGKPGSLMPAFAREHGGILSQEQVASLVDYLVKDFPKEAKMVYQDPRGPSAPAPLAVPEVKPVTNSSSAALPRSASLPRNASVFPVQKVP